VVDRSTRASRRKPGEATTRARGWSAEIEEDTPAAEELAVTVRDEAPGATSDEADGYVEDEETP
jgi:DNA-binding IclR family transcriptional regulator